LNKIGKKISKVKRKQIVTWRGKMKVEGDREPNKRNIEFT
jgi:hypothetical protein